MRSFVVIKSNRAGMTVILDPQLPFGELLEEVGKKFRESARFWGSEKIALSFAGRDLSVQEELSLVDVITQNSMVNILCLLDPDEARAKYFEKELANRLLALSVTTGEFYRGELLRGDILESESSVVIIGDVDHGAKVTAKGNVIVLGELKGSVSAGSAGGTDAVIFALEMAPLSLSIGEVKERYSDRGRRLGKGPMTACLEDGQLKVRSLAKKSLMNIMKNFV